MVDATAGFSAVGGGLLASCRSFLIGATVGFFFLCEADLVHVESIGNTLYDKQEIDEQMMHKAMRVSCVIIINFLRSRK